MYVTKKITRKNNSISDYGKMLTYRENIGKPIYRSISNLNSTVFCPIHTKISLLNLFFSRFIYRLSMVSIGQCRGRERGAGSEKDHKPGFELGLP